MEWDGWMAGWHHWFNGHEFGQTLGDGKGQKSLTCCSPWGCKEWDTTWWLKNSNLRQSPYFKVIWLISLNVSANGSVVKNLPAGDAGSIPGLGRSPGEGNGYPLQYSCLENSMDRGAWRVIVHGFTKSGLDCTVWAQKVTNKARLA